MAASSGTMMAASAGTQMMGSLSSGFSQAGAAKAQGDYQSTMYRLNAQLAGMQGEDAIKRGDKQAEILDRKTGQMIGEQRAGYAGQGVDVNTGSAAQVQAQTEQMSQMDQLTIKNNAWREAWGYKVQANDLMGKSQFAQLAGDAESSNTLLTAGTKALGYGFQAGGYAYGYGKKGT